MRCKNPSGDGLQRIQPRALLKTHANKPAAGHIEQKERTVPIGHAQVHGFAIQPRKLGHYPKRRPLESLMRRMTSRQPRQAARKAVGSGLRAVKITPPVKAKHWTLNLRNAQSNPLRDLSQCHRLHQPRHPFEKVQPTVERGNFGIRGVFIHDKYYCI